MKTKFSLSLVLISFLFLMSCTQHSYESKLRVINKAIDEELNSGYVVDSIFLDYRFNMSKSEFTKHSRKLLRKGKLKAEDKKIYYTLHLGVDTHKLYLLPRFTDDKLSELLLVVTEHPISAAYTSITICNFYLEKYARTTKDGRAAQIFLTENSKQPRSCMVKGNLVIEFYSNSHNEAIIKYSDSRLNAIKEAKEEAEKNKQLKDL